MTDKPCYHSSVRVEAVKSAVVIHPDDTDKPDTEQRVGGYAVFLRLYCQDCNEPMKFVGVPKTEEKYKGTVDIRAPRLDSSGYEMTVVYAPDGLLKRSTVYLLAAWREGAR